MSNNVAASCACAALAWIIGGGSILWILAGAALERLRGRRP